MNTDLIFAAYGALGFQDIWFVGLEPGEVAQLFDYACLTYGRRAPLAQRVVPIQRSESAQHALGLNSEVPDIDYAFAPLRVDDTVLEGVVIRIENNRLAIDFNSGLDYWNRDRQAAFIKWLRDLHRQVPRARLEWAHEGCANSPCRPLSELLNTLVADKARP